MQQLTYDVEVRSTSQTGHFAPYTVSVTAPTSQDAEGRVQRSNPGAQVRVCSSYYKNGGSNNSGGSDSGEVSDSTLFWGTAALGLVGFGLATAFLGPFFSGPAFAFGAYKGLEKVTGKDKSDYEAVATGQSKSVGSIICLALIIAAGIGGVRFGVNYQADVREIDANKTEQVSQ